MIYGISYELPARAWKIRSFHWTQRRRSSQYLRGSRPRLTRARSMNCFGISIPYAQRVCEKPKPLQSDTFLAVPVSRFRSRSRSRSWSRSWSCAAVEASLHICMLKQQSITGNQKTPFTRPYEAAAKRGGWSRSRLQQECREGEQGKLV